MIKIIFSSSSKNKSSAGFTLIEVILAISILATMSVLVATSLSRALKAKRKIQTEVQDVSALRDAIKIMRADIQLAYNHYDFEKEIFDQATKANPAAGAGANAGPSGTNATFQGQNPYTSALSGADPNSQRQNKRVDPKTDFIGEESKLDFVTMNNGRLMANDVQADFIEVGYFVRDCKNLSQENSSSQCLFRRTQKVLDNDVTKGGSEVVLLENVKEFKLRYTGQGKKEWVREWKTKGGLDDTTKNLFPDAVEINLGIERQFDGKPRAYSLQYVVPVHFPNNVKQKNSNTSNNLNGTAPPPVGTVPPPGI